MHRSEVTVKDTLLGIVVTPTSRATEHQHRVHKDEMADGSGGDGQAPPQAKTWLQNFASVFNLTHELPVGWDPQKLEFPEKLKLGIGQKVRCHGT